MSTEVVNIAEAAKQPSATGLSEEGTESTAVYSGSSQENFEASIPIDKMINASSTHDTVALSQSENGTNENPSFCSESADGSREKKENALTHGATENEVKRIHRNVLDSDSEEEDDFVSSLWKENNTVESSEPSETVIKKSDPAKLEKRSRRIIDSESEDDDFVIAVKNANSRVEDSCNEEQRLTEPVRKKTMFSTIVDSTSDDEDDSKGSAASLLAVKNKNVTSNRNNKARPDTKIVKSKISSLIDTDSEDDDDDAKCNDADRTLQDEEQRSGKFAKKPEKSSKKRTGSIRSSKKEAMQKIHSETQRLIRNSEVSLPYHRPKQRSLQEFLNRRQFVPVLPEGLTTAAKVKMSSEIVSKILEEKEKEAELFYKSSDSEDDSAISSTPANPQEESEGSSSVTHIDHFNIEDTQKILKNDVQNAHNKKEIIQQGAVDLGLPRKLFANETKDSASSKPAEAECNDEEVSECEDPRKKTKETRHGLREASVPRKLFGSDYDDAVAPSNGQESLDSASRFNEIVESTSETAESMAKGSATDSLVENDSAGTKSKLLDSSSDERAKEVGATACNTIAVENTEFSNISDTPFIRSDELAKLNEKGKASRQRADVLDNLEEDENSREPEVPIGHVFGLPPPEFDTYDPPAENCSGTKKKLPSSVASVCPRLRGAPGTFIDLSDDVRPNRDGVRSLVDRFIRHSAANKPAEVSASVAVLHTEKTADGLKITEEILPYNLPTTENYNDKELSKPGVKRLQLKNDLIVKMAKKRDEEWRSKKQREKDDNDEEDEEIDDESECEDEDEPLDVEIEVSGESEPEENDLPRERKKKRKPCDFADEEAEVSGEEDDQDDEEMEVSDENEEEEEEEEIVDRDNACDILSDAQDEIASERKRPSRIVKAFEDDSNSLPETSLPSEMNSREKVFERTKTDVDIFAPDSGNDGCLSDAETELSPSQMPPRDQLNARSQQCKTPLTALDVLRFVSPITQLTAFNSNSPQDSPASKVPPGTIRRIAETSLGKTPLDERSPISSDFEKRNSGQKKLFEDTTAAVNDDELLDLCSGRFTGMEGDDRGTESRGKLLESQLSARSSKAAPTVVDDASQDIRLTLDGSSDDSRDKIVSEQSTTESGAPWANFKVVSSSDEDNSRDNRIDENVRRKKVKKKKVRQLELSDDEELEGSSGKEEDACVTDNDDNDKYVDYDSEENEVVIVPKKDIKKVAAGFLDEEAELSESEWGSADEDEKELDKLELEEGDDEEIDENHMRDQLGRMHVRQVLDDDQREVRMLKELLFDDGDLHTGGGGRERQFKWKNIDNLGDDDKLGPLDNEIDESADVVEEENDLEWRKQRLEREKFIEEKMKNSADAVADKLDGGSQIFQLGKKALEKSKTIHSSLKGPDPTSTKKPLVPRTVLDLLSSNTMGQNSKVLNKAARRGSFLARGDECLARLAVQIKHSETTITTRKNPRNFVFMHISPSVAGTAEKEQNDETKKTTDSPAITKGTKRKPPTDVTPRTAKKAKVEVTRSSGKKLF